MTLATVLGGSRQFAGPIVGAFTLVSLQALIWRVAYYHQLILGMMLIMLVLAFPGGVVVGPSPSLGGHAT